MALMGRKVKLELSVGEAWLLFRVLDEWDEYNREFPVEEDPEIGEKRRLVGKVINELCAALGQASK
ncbi:MAG: hypothetical protein DRJ67_04120 [Thermoprotei archaeon]|nr:MAG: hypothetical protein DRJ67_04120 [Thermoprotei archaeon]